jgi:bifunctional enzyme CysN/CysC
MTAVLAQAARLPDTIPANANGEAPLPIVFVGHVDHGKSTLLGRILHDTDSLPDGKLAELRAISAKRGLENEWSFALDALQIERDQGITVDTTQVWFRTRRRTYRAIDAPGHAEFVRNMATGASAAAAAVLVVDAKQGIGEQTRRHAAILDLLGLKRVVVAVNKMDLVDFAQDRFGELVREIGALFDTLGGSVAAIVPIAARTGDNIATRSAATPWYRGATLLDVLDGFDAPKPLSDGPLRLPVQDVYRRGDKRFVVGRIESGRLAVGDGIRIVPGGRLARVAEFHDWNRTTPRTRAEAGESVAIAFDTEVFAERGSWITTPDTSRDAGDVLRVRLLWLGAEALAPGKVLRVALGTAQREAKVERIGQVIEPGHGTAKPGTLGRNGLASVDLKLAAPIAADSFAELPATGRGIVVEGGRVVGGFVVERATDAVIAAPEKLIFPIVDPIDAASRHRANGHRAGVFWLTGLSGAGKSTLAQAAARRLFELGRQVRILDGDDLRNGLNADLGFTPEDRDENVRRTAHVARLFAQSGFLVIVALISPLRTHRDLARKLVGDEFHEIHIQADIDACRQRDPKGLYARADSGKIGGFTGVSAPYEDPASPDLALDTVALSPVEAVDRLVDFVETHATGGR